MVIVHNNIRIKVYGYKSALNVIYSLMVKR